MFQRRINTNCLRVSLRIDQLNADARRLLIDDRPADTGVDDPIFGFVLLNRRFIGLHLCGNLAHAVGKPASGPLRRFDWLMAS